jgi:hypothetical protein
VLVFCKLRTPDQIEAIRRTARLKSTPVEHAIVSLGLATEVQIAETLARYSGLRFVKINPLDLDLDVVTTALSGPFARRHGLIAISKNATTLTVAVHDPLAHSRDGSDRDGAPAGSRHHHGGRIRHTETAEYAVQAALTGHLVLSTLHTNDAPSSITRLLDLKVPGFLISSTVLGILAQRLVRVICTHCAEEYEPAYEESLALNMPFEQLASRTLRRTLREAVIEKVLNGTTTVSEMVRVAGK